MKLVLYALAVLTAIVVSASAAFAQALPAHPTDHLEWSIDAASLGEAQGYRYDISVDDVTLPAALTPVECITTTPPTTNTFVCDAPIPAITPTLHRIRVRAATTERQGLWSEELTIDLTSVPNTPQGLIVKRKIIGAALNKLMLVVPALN